MGKLQVEWTAHADFERMLAEVFQDDPIEGIKELVANGFDADASRFDIKYDSKSGLLVAKDNGLGMGVYELRQGFYKSGDSLTRKAEKTKRGRNPMGSYGIGTIVMQYLARRYTLETWRDGQKLTVEEQFEEGKRPRKIVKAVPEVCDPNLHGTTITIDQIRFSPDDLSLEQLTRRLVLGINVESRLESGDRFEMYVNGEKVGLKNPQPAMVFALNKLDDLIGHVHGKVNFYHSVPPYRGVLVRVNGRQVGSEEYFDDIIDFKMRGRIYADIDVDMMSSRISFSRARFQEDSPHFKRLIQVLNEAFKSFKGDVERYTQEKMMVRSQSAVETALSGAVAQLEQYPVVKTVPAPSAKNKLNMGYLNLPRSKSLSSEIESEGARDLGDILQSAYTTGGRKVVLVADNTKNFGSIDHTSQVISLNINHPYFFVPGAYPEKSLQVKILYALSHVLGLDKLDSELQTRMSKAISTRDEAIWRLTQQVFSGQPRLLDALLMKKSKYSKKGVSPDRMYTSVELGQESPIDKVWLNKFQQAGILRPTIVTDNEDRYYGANVLLALARLKGCTPAFQLVREYAAAEKTDVTRQRHDQMVQNIDESIARVKTPISYVFNISVTNSSLYIVMSGYEKKFIELYKAGHIIARHVIPPELAGLEKAVTAEPPKNSAVGIKGTQSWSFMQFASKETRHPGLSKGELAKATAYNTLGNYSKGDIILHEGFGFGRIIDVQGKTCDVQFKGEKVRLAHNR